MQKKILVVSDTHGYLENFYKVLEKHRDVDLIIHLGDVCNDEREIEYSLACPVKIIRGNNDWSGDLPEKIIMNICGHRIFATHGHRYRVNYGLDVLIYAAMEKECDIVMYGHTHVPMLLEEENMLIMNPGSLTYPRQVGGRPSYIVMGIEDDDSVECNIEYL